MDDLISRQAAIDLCDWYDNPSMHDDLEKMPSAQRWTPVSEQLPKISSARLALRYSNGLVTGGTYLGNKTFDVDFPDCNKKTTVMEWMQLPAPYNAQALERDCERCVHNTDGGCESWDCEFEEA